MTQEAFDGRDHQYDVPDAQRFVVVETLDPHFSRQDCRGRPLCVHYHGILNSCYQDIPYSGENNWVRFCFSQRGEQNHALEEDGCATTTVEFVIRAAAGRKHRCACPERFLRGLVASSNGPQCESHAWPDTVVRPDK